MSIADCRLQKKNSIKYKLEIYFNYIYDSIPEAIGQPANNTLSRLFPITIRIYTRINVILL